MALTLRRPGAAPADLEERIARIDPAAGRIPAWIFSDPELYRLELERIFARCWLCVGHEAEIPQPGDYVTRTMGEHPVIVARGLDGQVHVLLNVCRHRGMRVCRSDRGHSSHFRCPYHGFTYSNDGTLVGVPFEKEIYGDTLDKRQWGLIRARVDRYAGLIFATWDPQAPSLQEYLGPIRWYLDLMVGRCPMEVYGPQRIELPANWKLPAENFASDAYHTMYSHASIAKLGLTPTVKWAKTGYMVTAGNGHGTMLGITGQGTALPPEALAEARRRLRPEQFELLQQISNMQITVFPNLSFLISSIRLGDRFICHTDMFLWNPRGATRTEVLAWLLLDGPAPQEWKELSRQAFILTFGTSGMLSQDDATNWTDVTRNSMGPLMHRLEFNYEMGIGKPPLPSFPGPGTVYEGKYNEANARAFYARWRELLLEGAGGVPAERGEG